MIFLGFGSIMSEDGLLRVVTMFTPVRVEWTDVEHLLFREIIAFLVVAMGLPN